MGFAGKAADDAVLSMMADSDAATRLAGIDMAMRRRMTVAVPALVKLSTDNDAKILDAAVKGLGDLGSDKEIPALLAVIKKSPQSETAARALASLCTRYARPRAGKGCQTSGWTTESVSTGMARCPVRMTAPA